MGWSPYNKRNGRIPSSLWLMVCKSCLDWSHLHQLIEGCLMDVYRFVHNVTLCRNLIRRACLTGVNVNLSIIIRVDVIHLFTPSYVTQYPHVNHVSVTHCCFIYYISIRSILLCYHILIRDP